MIASRKKRRVKESLGSRIFDVCNVGLMCVVCISILFPLWNMVVVSLSRLEDISYTRLNLWPRDLVLDSYRYIFNTPTFVNAFFISISRTVAGTIYHVLVISLGAYALTRQTLPFRRTITVIFVITMFFGGGLIPGYINIRNLGLLNNFFVYIIPPAFSMFTTVITRNFFFSIDPALEESATIDGASAMRVLIHIVLPLSTPVLATISLWSMVGQWNSWFDNLIYCSSDSLLTLQLLLRRTIVQPEEFSISARSYATLDRYGAVLNAETIKAATTVMVILPIVCVYPFLQKYFVKGIMLGAVKG